MTVAFWNNPIVVSALRVRFRRGRLFSNIMLYLLLLVAGATFMRYQGLQLAGSWPETYFVTLIAIQCLVSGLYANTRTRQSLRTEVQSRTLDFQRIASLSPRQILVGKLLGEPAMSYFLVTATIPLAVLCWLMGAVSLPVLLLMYLNLATTVVLFGAMGLPMQVDAPPGAAAEVRGTMLLVWLTPYFLYLRFGANLGNLFTVPWASALIGMLIPLPALYGIAEGDPWFSMSFFGATVPYLLVTPLSQTFLAFLCFRVMERQLIHPVNPPMSKLLAYVTLLLLDLVTAGVLFDMGSHGLAPGPRCVVFWLMHFFGCLALIGEATPAQAALQSWIWRLAGEKPCLREWWLGDRSPNGLLLLTFCGIGVIVVGLVVLIPAICQADSKEIAEGWLPSLLATILTSILILSLGMLYQFFAFTMGTGSSALLAVVIAPMWGTFHLAGWYYRQPWLEALSPSAWFWHWLGDDPLPPVLILPLLAYMLAPGLLGWTALAGSMHRLAREVDGKLRQMGARAAAEKENAV